MVVRRKHRGSESGQAAIEMALVLPFVIWLIYYTINAFLMVHTAHVAQRYAAMGLWKRVGHRAKFVVDDQDPQVHNKGYMAVRYAEPDGTFVRRKIVNPGGSTMLNVIGVCREQNCRP